MEPNKLETQFKEQLNSREIKPSEMAWSKLDAMLTVAEKPRAKFPWLFIAASFVGFLLIGTVYFNGFKTIKIDKGNPVVLEEKIDRNNLEEPEIVSETVLPNRIKKTTIKVHKIVADNNNLKKQPKQLNNKEEEVLIINQSKENGAVVNSSENKNSQSTSVNKYISAEKLLAEVTNTKFEPKAIDKTHEKTRKAIAVNPNSLLANAETELNQSFRESALDKFNKNFNAIKTVLVNRNYEE
ncbi:MULTISPECIES: hypothetical protein [Flavobacterium]|uniref:Uncharacterized protein n=1 Tax=Flavobacterium ranwuense TaxID=2541725 RepID=A0ABY2DS41_9FLAO|nr:MULTISPECIES: hypothetical protein [Flavobacterium]TDE29711.1 hypothetical protein E0I61_06945 [Flavobacterium ranwuense]TDE54193.1 hypothetical protein E0H99_04905 [Flavobacterium sp. GT3P67]